MSVTNSSRLNIMHVVGARPNFVKVAPLMREMARYPDEFQQVLVHTGQHYDYNMSKVFLEELELPIPDVYLGAGSGSHAQQTAKVMMNFEPVLLERRPDWVFVVGDVNSTLACALTAAKLGMHLAHVEAGLRSYDCTMPEEYNRLLTDQIANLLFTPSSDADKNLLREGISPDRIHFVGNVMIDTLVRLLPKAAERWNKRLTERFSIKKTTRYILVTLHRPSNVDAPAALKELVATLTEVARDLPVIFAVHPRTRSRLDELGIDGAASSGCHLHLTEPLPYVDFLALEQHAALVLTDSGGVQEETTYLGVPCLTIRSNTERPITITQGTNQLVSQDRESLLGTISQTLANNNPLGSDYEPPELWDGQAARRVVDVMRSS